MEENRDNLLEVIQALYRQRRVILNVCLVALVASVSISLLLDNYYEAKTVFYPTSPRLANPELLFGYTGQVTDYFGSDRDLDRLAEIARSREVEDFLIERFDLYTHYGIDSTSKRGIHKLRKRLRKLYTVQKNKNDAIELTVEDRDPQVAADMANAARQKIDEIAQRLTKESQLKLLNAFENNLKRKQVELERLADSLRRVQAFYNIYDVGTQSAQIAGQLSLADLEVIRYRARLEVLESDPNVPRDTLAFIRANLKAYEQQRQQLRAAGGNTEVLTVDRLNEAVPRIAILQDMHYQARKQLTYDLERYNQILATYSTDIPALLVIEAAEPPPVKSRPVRSLIVLASLLGTFLFTSLAVLVADAYRGVRWRSLLTD
jgi:capsule polysaccharide export protein KpsE/RkpR